MIETTHTKLEVDQEKHAAGTTAKGPGLSQVLVDILCGQVGITLCNG
jgi:hypothetical protein